MPRWMLIGLATLATLSLLPLACIARARTLPSRQPRVQLIRHMGKQISYRKDEPSAIFADGRSARPPVAGTVARGQLRDDDAFYRGVAGSQWLTAIPVPVDEAFVQRGRERYDIYCSPCHGLAGYGDGPVARRADALLEGTWVPPSSLHDPVVMARPDGHLFHTIGNGIRNMPPYGPQIAEADRWAVVAYVRALQRSQRGTLADVPPEERRHLAPVTAAGTATTAPGTPASGAPTAPATAAPATSSSGASGGARR